MSARHLVVVALAVLFALELILNKVDVVPVLALAWLAVGIGHGFFDVLLLAELKSISLRRATGVYFSMALIAATITIFFPIPALAVHGIVSAYHFGQAEWGHPPSAISERASVFLWGASVVTTMVLGPWRDSTQVIGKLVGPSAAGLIETLSRQRIPLLILSAAVGVFAIVYLSNRRASSDDRGTLARLLEFGLLQLLFLSTPLWLGFALYLSIWHGLGSLLADVWPLLRKKFGAATRNYAAAVSVLVAITGSSLFYAFFRFRFANEIEIGWSNSPALFAFIVAVTAPHVLTMDLAVKRRP